ncbi:wax ester synthase-like acyl-CoA acyltransferase family protein [Nocardioides sp. J9]|uniref:wax ester/triacylglycerol synthase domain-containing protein n=1 Tax=Nocardioides sp. J9 TaxID=935844 RepID=UPI00119D1535|nr:wax ester/triacylglycerol synthase domain-containing protein [Nocardioides sp. J9]TWH01838.1 wax ester synthase-like acyl-CoA acyltransferase family protein [Nocardioides sp. J9]
MTATGGGRRVRPAIERMTGFDAGFLYMETPSVHMHTLKIAILEADEALSYDAFQAGILVCQGLWSQS